MRKLSLLASLVFASSIASADLGAISVKSFLYQPLKATIPINNVADGDYNNLTINLDDYTVSINGENILLTKKEIDLLWTLANHPQKAYTREELLNLLWGFDYFGDTRTVDSHIKRLRGKLGKQIHPNWAIKTIWGVGYKFEVISHEK